LLDGLFAHPAWLFNVVSNLNTRDGDRGQDEFFRSLLGVPNPGIVAGVMMNRLLHPGLRL
jgi:hypothetical protein